MNDKQITVRELIELLKNEEPNAFVWVEGCDCYGEANGIKRMDDNPNTILITRP